MSDHQIYPHRVAVHLTGGPLWRTLGWSEDCGSLSRATVRAEEIRQAWPSAVVTLVDAHGNVHPGEDQPNVADPPLGPLARAGIPAPVGPEGYNWLVEIRTNVEAALETPNGELGYHLWAAVERSMPVTPAKVWEIYVAVAAWMEDPGRAVSVPDPLHGGLTSVAEGMLLRRGRKYAEAIVEAEAPERVKEIELPWLTTSTT